MALHQVLDSSSFCLLELGLDAYTDTIYKENDVDTITAHDLPPGWDLRGSEPDGWMPGTTGLVTGGHAEAFVLVEKYVIESRVVHDHERDDKRCGQRFLEAGRSATATCPRAPDRSYSSSTAK
jgi:hypothetical protein